MGRKEWGGEGGYAPLALAMMDAPEQKHRLIARKIIFIVPPCTPGPKSGGDNFRCTPLYPMGPKSGGTMSPHTPGCAAHEVSYIKSKVTDQKSSRIHNPQCKKLLYLHEKLPHLKCIRTHKPVIPQYNVCILKLPTKLEIT